jgi:DnaK suppressor protein
MTMTALAFESRHRLEARCAAIERELSETRAALLRMERGTYGRCDVCGGAIGRQRLLALPVARYCLECASRDA